jgi:hypothetical protein
MTTLPQAMGSMLRLFPRGAGPSRPCDLPSVGRHDPAFCRDGSPAALDVTGLRESARRLGVLCVDDYGWFGELVRARLCRALFERTVLDWERVYPGLDVEARAERHVAAAARRAAFTGGISASFAHVGEVVTVITEGLAAPLCVPAVAAALVGDVVACAKVQIELVFDLASIHGVGFDLHDTAELASIFELALRSSGRADAEPEGMRPAPAAGDALMARLGRGLLDDAMVGLVPFAGIPFSATSNYRATRRVAAAARRSLRRRAALREALASAAFTAPPTLLIEGIWLLATVDGRATQRELGVVAAVARAVAPEAPGVLDQLDACDEQRWLDRAAALGGEDRKALLSALSVLASLRGPTCHPERAFLSRVGHALCLPVDFAAIDAAYRRLGDEAAPAR